MTIEPEKEEGLMGIPEFAKRYLRCSQSMAWKLAKEGAFPVIRNGRLVRVEPKKALAAYIAKFSKLPRK
jgi:hypothetical protein